MRSEIREGLAGLMRSQNVVRAKVHADTVTPEDLMEIEDRCGEAAYRMIELLRLLEPKPRRTPAVPVEPAEREGAK